MTHLAQPSMNPLLLYLVLLKHVLLLLTHLSRMEISTFINLVSGLLDAICIFSSNYNRTICKQTLETLIIRRVLWHLIWVCIVCLFPTKRTLGLTPCMLRNCSCFRCRLLTFLKTDFEKKAVSRSRLTFCRSLSGYKLFKKAIIRQH